MFFAVRLKGIHRSTQVRTTWKSLGTLRSPVNVTLVRSRDRVVIERANQKLVFGSFPSAAKFVRVACIGLPYR